MSKPKLLYYRILNFHDDNLTAIKTFFDPILLEDPSYDTDEILASVEVCFAPLGFPFDGPKMDKCPRLKVVA